MRRAGEEGAQLSGGVGGRVAVALSIASHIALLPRVLQPFRARFPAVQLRVVEGIYPAAEAGLRDGTIDFHVGPEPWGALAPELVQDTLFANTRIVLGRAGHSLAGAQTLAELEGAEWATTSVTLRADEKLGELFRQHGLARLRLALQSQSALTLIAALANTDLLAMAPAQWQGFAPLVGTLATIPVQEVLPAPDVVVVRRAGLPLPPAAAAFADLLRSAAES